MPYKYHDLPWAKLFRRSCGDRFKTLYYRGRCELARNHTIPHAAERGMEWVRWDERGLWFTVPGDANQDPVH